MILMQTFQKFELFSNNICRTHSSNFFQIINFELSHFLLIQIFT
jgi:hypothetical protein